jgi:hypothetical protein
MHLVRRIGLLVLFLAWASSPLARAADVKPEDAAQKAAEAWLALVDAGKYGESWNEASTLLKGQVTREKWEQTAPGVRNPLGKLVSRKVKSRTYTETVPGAPDGKYVVIQYESSFEKKKSAIETVTPMLDGARGWRVAGYFLQ